ncbi:Ankyrin repeat domain-containing protein 55 [Hondaea fermentalgiana]|uniref:Ankyrin repeat domain-containing protein 55 n=1 Tax=Hondaea fermentalgiana TaxID=2315210 RepID=A0A2R5GI14_9STRA|nr:Ankyrin repeat domain-containing protein 55 [Hondaea fermentalgiana]|eukprot:GBG27931.1 Ankyrin repeat domain-containing protein 55 [Hondaea fermentalgiana]
MAQEGKTMEAQAQREAYESERAHVNELFAAAATNDVNKLKDLAGTSTSREQMLGYKDANGRSMLHFAATQGHDDVCKWLLDGLATKDAQHIAVNATDKQGDSALRLAVRVGHAQVAKFLFDLGGSSGSTVLDAGESKEELKRKPSLLHEAASSGEVDMVRVALEDFGLKSCINEATKTGPPIFWAAFNANEAMVQQLLEAGADPNVRDEDGHSALLVAATRDAPEVVRMLLEAGADMRVSTGADDETTVVHAAAASGADETLNAIAEAVPDAFAKALDQEADGFRPIELAAYSGHVGTARTIAELANQDLETVQEICAKMEERREKEMNEAAEELENGLEKCAQARNEGNEAFKSGELENALAAYGAGVEMAAAMLAKFHARLQRMGGDPTCDAQITRIKEEALAVLLCNRSACALKLGQTELARDDGQQAAELRPKWPKAHFRLGQALAVLGENADAAQSFWTGYELAPKEPGAAALLNLFKQSVAKAKKQHQQNDDTTQEEAEDAEPLQSSVAPPTPSPTSFQHEVPVEIPADASPDAPLRSLVMRFNDGEDPFRVATRFVQENGLDGSLVHRIAHHVHEVMTTAPTSTSS